MQETERPDRGLQLLAQPIVDADSFERTLGNSGDFLLRQRCGDLEFLAGIASRTANARGSPVSARASTAFAFWEKLLAPRSETRAVSDLSFAPAVAAVETSTSRNRQ